MSFYPCQLCYSKDAVKAMVANPGDRDAAARKLIKALGARRGRSRVPASRRMAEPTKRAA